MASFWSKQPFKAALTLATLLLTPPYLFFLTLYYIPKSLRPDPGWSISTSAANALLRIIFNWSLQIQRAPEYISKAGNLGDRFVRVQPAPRELYPGILDNGVVKPALVTAVWFPKAPTNDDIKTSKFVLHFQGGAFVLAPHPVPTGEVPTKVFAERLQAFTFYAQYRVSRDEATRFPAALQDVVTFYRHLLDLRIPAKNIIISGDSAGGNLVIALARYIGCSDLPKPLGMMAWSPWLDVNQSAIERYKKSPYKQTDWLSWPLLQWGLNAYSPKTLSQEQEQYISPAQHPFATNIPFFIQVGTRELFIDEVRAFSARMSAIQGNRIKLVEIPGAMHVVLQVGKLTGFQNEVNDAAEEAKRFIFKTDL